MNPHRIYLIAILLLAFGVGATGQEPPKAVLIDEFSMLTCDDFLGRLDMYLSELRNVPASKGVVIIGTTQAKGIEALLSKK